MKKPLLRLLAMFMAFGLIAAACGDSDSDDAADDATDDTAGTSEPADPLVIGYVLPQTGGLSAIIDALLKPVEMAVQEINAAGGNIELIPGDSGTDVNVGSATVDGLINDDVDVIIGPASTTVTLGVIDKITSSGILQCSGSTTGAVFSTYEDNGYYFRTSPPDSLQGPALADVVSADGATSVAIIYRSDEYGVGFKDFLAAGLTSNGVAVAAEVAVDENATSYDAEIGEVAAAGVDAIVLITFAEGATVMQGMIESGLGPDDMAVYVADGFKDNVKAADVDPDDPAVLDGVRGTAPSVAPPDGDPTFLDRLEAFAPGTPTIFSGHFYDCVNIVALASLSAGSTDPADMVGEMQGVTNGGTACISYEACAEILAEGGDINYQGASGVTDLNSVGEVSAGTYDVFEYDAEGTAVTESQVTFAND